MASSETAPAAGQRAKGLAPFLRSQMRNIAPFLTLIFLSAFFALASPLARRSRMMLMTSFLAPTSMPRVGSHSTRSFGG